MTGCCSLVVACALLDKSACYLNEGTLACIQGRNIRDAGSTLSLDGVPMLSCMGRAWYLGLFRPAAGQWTNGTALWGERVWCGGRFKSSWGAKHLPALYIAPYWVREQPGT